MSIIYWARTKDNYKVSRDTKGLLIAKDLVIYSDLFWLAFNYH